MIFKKQFVMFPSSFLFGKKEQQKQQKQSSYQLEEVVVKLTVYILVILHLTLLGSLF